MKRIVIHWTAGRNTVSNTDKRHYHFIVAGDGEVVPGDRNPEANLNVNDGDYAAHTRRLNTGSIGVAMAGMLGAREAPFDMGKEPLTSVQVGEMAELVADLCQIYDIEVTPKTVLTHAEVQGALGVKQRGKWDVMWLPGMKKPQPARAVGDILRSMISDAIEAEGSDEMISMPKAEIMDIWEYLGNFIGQGK